SPPATRQCALWSYCHSLYCFLRDLSPALYFFFLLLARPPISTLFPYTTLFRSASAASCRAAARLHLQFAAACATCERGPRPQVADRKSTRLNSSHQIISYAVFCLKKKKKEKLAQSTTQAYNRMTTANTRTKSCT